MNENRKRLRTRFARPTRFAVRPGPVANRPSPPDNELEELKNRLLAERLRIERAFVPGETLRRAADEAASLAWLTPFPLLVLPGLFDELVSIAATRTRKQAEILHRSQMLQAA